MAESSMSFENHDAAAQTTRRVEDLWRSRELLKRVITDRSADMLQIVEDGLEARIYLLRSSLRTGKLRPESMERELRQWVREEEQQTNVRLSQLSEHAARGIERWTGTEVTARPRAVRVLSQVPALTLEPPMAREVKGLAAAGSGVVVGAAAWLLLTLITWPAGLLGICVGLGVGGVSGVVTAVVVWTLLGRMAGKPATEPYLAETGAAILAGFREGIESNARQLSALTDKYYAAVIPSMEDQKPDRPAENRVE